VTLSDLESLRAAQPTLWALAAGLVGLCVGSFLNVCAHRLPKGESVVTPASRCACGAPIPGWLNLPLLGWLMLRGRARCCGRPISFRYPLIELAGGLALAAAWTWLPMDKALAASALLPLLILLTACDIDSMLVPDAPNFLLVAAGLVASATLPGIHGLAQHPSPWPWAGHVASLGESLTGVATGTALAWWVRTLGSVWAGKEAMGEADIILCAGLGAFGGWQGALFAFFGGSVLGVALVLPSLIRARIKGLSGPTAVPFVPALSLAGALWFFRGPEVVGWWLGTR
jgi:leader peptidase (prepilin peptidase) / N-methyltransferase